jgi:hypothetical protein
MPGITLELAYLQVPRQPQDQVSSGSSRRRDIGVIVICICLVLLGCGAQGLAQLLGLYYCYPEGISPGRGGH